MKGSIPGKGHCIRESYGKYFLPPASLHGRTLLRLHPAVQALIEIGLLAHPGPQLDQAVLVGAHQEATIPIEVDVLGVVAGPDLVGDTNAIVFVLADVTDAVDEDVGAMPVKAT